MFAERIAFTPHAAADVLAQVPAECGVFSLHFGPGSEPYLAKAADLRRRLTRLLNPAPELSSAPSRRLNLRERVDSIAFSRTGSEFESLLLLYRASAEAFGPRAQQRLRLFAPMCVRLTVENAYPRTYITNRLSSTALASTYGPFASRNMAERYLDAVLDLFKLRRCHEELAPDPAFPGCVYSEMQKCLAPCFKGCTNERYAEEAAAVQSFLSTRGAALLDALAQKRDAASAALAFEEAAALHQQMERAKQAADLAPELVRPLAQLDALLLMPSTDEAAVRLFLVRAGIIRPPADFSVTGMRHPNEQSGSSSLFAHPAMLAAVPLEEQASVQTAPATRNELEQRLLAAIDTIANPARHATDTSSASSTDHSPGLPASAPRISATDRAAHLALLKRWYYRPAARRTGEIFFPHADGTWPVQRILRGVSRVFVAARQGTAKAPPPSAEIVHP